MKRGCLALFATSLLGLAGSLLAPHSVQQRQSTRYIAEHKQNLRGSASKHFARLPEYGNLPLSFEANQGQTDSRVKFLSRGRGYALFLTSEEAVLKLRSLTGKGDHPAARKPMPARADGKSDSQRSAMVRLKLEGANRSAQVRGVEELPGRSNYFRGNDPTNWRIDIPSYARVEYVEVYRGVDLVYYGNLGQLECDFVVAPDADPKVIRLTVEGARRMEIDLNGDLVLHTQNGDLLLRKPATYQEEDGVRKPVAARYVLRGNHRVGFALAPYDARKPLVIDPVLSYATFLGGSGSDFASAIAVDGAGNAYVTGMTVSPDFPTVMPIQPTYAGGNDAFVAKLNATGSGLIFSTFLGGTGLDKGNGIALDPAGNVYVTGQTTSPDFPLANAFQKTCANCPSGSHVFVAKLNPSGNALVYSSYLGGSLADTGFGIVADASGAAYVAGDTISTDFPTTPGAFQPTCAGGLTECTDGFVAKVKSDGSALAYSTYLGGTLDDHVTAIAIDSSGNAYVTGNTSSRNFPTTPGAFISTCDIATLCNGGFQNAFVTKLNATGSALVYSTYLGGSAANNAGEGIAVDAAGDAYVTGGTASLNFPTTSGVVQPHCTLTSDGLCDGNAFITEVKPDGSGLLNSTYLGGSFSDSGSGIAVDPSGEIYVVGIVTSGDFPTASQLQPCPATGITSSFVTKLNAAASNLVFSTCVAGLTRSNSFGGIALDSSGNVYLAGGGEIGFPTTAGVFRASGPGAAVVKISLVDAPGTAFSSQNLVFTDQTVGTTSFTQVITLFNMGSASLTINSIVASGDFGQTNNCGSTVASASACTINVTFSPTATGSRSGTIAITDNAAGSPQSLSLTGTGILPAATLAPSSLTFGSQQIGTSSAAQNITLSNTGIGPLVLTTIVPAPPGDFQEADDCFGLVPQGASCTLSVRFTPTAGAARTATLTLTDNAQNTPQLVPLTGTGIGPGISFSTTNVVFPNQSPGTTSMPQTVTIMSAGTAALTISSIQLPPAFSQSNNCGTSVAAGVSCALSVTFSPPTSGYYQGAIAISDNVPTSPQSITLSGSSPGTPTVALSSSSLAFGTVLEGTTSMPQSVTLSNSGNGPLNISSISVVGVDYTQTNSCGNSVAAGANCTISVSYAPSSSGTNQTRIDITDDAANSPQSIALSGTGTEFLLAPASGAPTSQTVNAGATTNYSLTLTPSAGTRDTVTLSCSGAPSAAVCSVSPTQQTFRSSSAVGISVSVSTTSRSALLMRPEFPNLYPFLRYLVVLAILIGLSIAGFLTRRAIGHTGALLVKRPGLCSVFVLVALLLVFIGCSGGNSAPPPPPSGGTPAGTYTLNVTAASASSTNPNQTVSLTLQVN